MNAKLAPGSHNWYLFQRILLTFAHKVTLTKRKISSRKRRQISHEQGFCISSHVYFRRYKFDSKSSIELGLTIGPSPKPCYQADQADQADQAPNQIN